MLIWVQTWHDNGTSITVDSTGAFPQTGNFIVRIDDELILVTRGTVERHLQ